MSMKDQERLNKLEHPGGIEVTSYQDGSLLLFDWSSMHGIGLEPSEVKNLARFLRERMDL